VCASVRSGGIAYVSDFCSCDVLAVQLAFFVVHLCVKSGDADTSADFKNRMEQMIVGALVCKKNLTTDGHAVCKRSKNECLMVLRSSFAAFFLRRLQFLYAINCRSFSS
jgi:hypothetical protein